MNSRPTEPLIHFTRAKLPFYFLVGIFVCIFTLNGLLKKIAGYVPDTISQGLFALATIPNKLYDSLPGSQYFLFELLVRWLFLSIAVFLLLLLLNSIRLKSAAVLCSGVSGLSAGCFIFTWFSLALYLIFIVLFVVSWIFGWISYLFSIVLSAIIAFLLWWPILYGLIGLGILIGIIWLISSFDDLWNKLSEFLRSNTFTESLLMKLLIGGVGLGFLAGAVYLIVKVWQAFLKPLFEIITSWISYYIVPIIRWIFWLLIVVVGAILIAAFLVLTLLILGYQYCDQFYLAKNCGRSTYKVFDTGFGLGVVIAVVLLVCSTNPDYQTLFNAAWNSLIPVPSNDFVGLLHSFMPRQAEILLQSLFVNASLPIFDVTSLVIAFFLTNCSLVMSLTTGTIEEPLRGLFKKERMPLLFLLTFGAVVVIASAVVGSITNGDD